MIKENGLTLIIDSDYLCYRAMLKMQGLSYEHRPTGVIYGFLKQLQVLAKHFAYPKFIFAWDSSTSYRKKLFPGYKKKDKQDPELEKLLYVSKPQFMALRINILPLIGFNNNFIQVGVEADDIIARIIIDHWGGLGPIFIVSGDADLYQLLGPDVSLYDPKTKAIYTENDFVKEKKIKTSQWSWVKAIGGCSSDKIPGIRGVGEESAIKYLRGENVGKKRKELIENFDPTFNLWLTTLPLHLCRKVDLKEDTLSLEAFNNVCAKYGLSSLQKKENFLQWVKILN